MATDISGYLRNILEATYGEQVRRSIHDAINAGHNDITNTTSALNEAAEAAQTAATNANTATGKANTATTKANNAAAAADSAAVEARTEISNMTAVISRAETAADNAEAVIDDVSDALTELQNRITEDMNPAIANANAAATSITEALTETQAAIEEAERQAEYAQTQGSAAYEAMNDTRTALEELQTLMAETVNPGIEEMTTQTNAAREQAAEADYQAGRAETQAEAARIAAADANAARDAANAAASAATEETENLQELKDDTDAARRSAAEAAQTIGTLTTNVNDVITRAEATITDTETARNAATRAAGMITGLTVTSQEGENASASVWDDGGHWNIHFTLGRGRDGSDFKISGSAYPTLVDLEAAVSDGDITPSEGDVYNVGTEAPYNLYRWTGTTWEDQGTIGVSFENLTTGDIDNIWAGNSIGDKTKYLNQNGLAHIVRNNLANALSQKVDVITGKGLSTYDFDDVYKNRVDKNLADIETLNRTKVTAVAGKDLSDQNYTIEEKNKLAAIEAEANKITVDRLLNGESTNPVENAAVTSAVNDLSGNISSLGTDFADEYNPNGTYTIGKYCTYRSILYRATVNISNPDGDFNPTHWTAVNITSELVSMTGGSADTIASRVDQHSADFAPAYRETATYAVGAYCIYNDALYKCKTAITSADGAFNAEHWTLVNIANEFISADKLKVNKAGDTMTGQLLIKISGDSNVMDQNQQSTAYAPWKSIKLQTTSNKKTNNSDIYAFPPITEASQIVNTDAGNVFVLDSGGNAVLGSGEAGSTIYKSNTNKSKYTGEHLHLASDGYIYLYTGVSYIDNASTEANQMRTWVLTNAGVTQLPKPLGTAYGGTGQNGVDTAPTASSNKMVTSGGIKTALDAKANLSGATFTGNVVTRKSGSTIGFGTYHGSAKVGTIPSSTLYGTGYRVHDSAGNAVAYLRDYYSSNTNGAVGIQLEAVRNVNSKNIYNNLTLGIDKNGNRVVSVTEPAKWVNAIGLAPKKVGTQAATKPANVTEYTIDARQSGYVVSVHIYVKLGARLTAWSTIASRLPKPASGGTIYSNAPANTTGYIPDVRLQITTGGLLQCHYGGAASYCTHFTYIAATL